MFGTFPRTVPWRHLPPEISETIEQFLRERQQTERLLAEGFMPPCSLLLTGAPGTGKSMLARSLARSLHLPFLVQDLATSISSFLGKTGLNLRRTLDYARNNPCVLLLDEFDAIAKRRDDASEIGELKRIVNVLLNELENWPLHSVLVAATNHPALLDPAIRRRFDVVIDLPLPGEIERGQILERAAGPISRELSSGLIQACAANLNGYSGSDLEAIMHAAVRAHLTKDVPLARSLVIQVQRGKKGLENKAVGHLIRTLREQSSEEYSVRDLAALFERSASTIQHHLKKEMKNG